MDLKDIKLEYIREELNIEQLAHSPGEQLEKWMQDAIDAEISYPNAITLSTIDKDGFPNARIVLAKDIQKDGLVFFTDYTSSKALELIKSRKVSVLFFWKELDRQIRIQGEATKIDPEESEEYFLSRPYESQISALASNQSSVISKEELVTRVEKLKEQYSKGNVPYPANWGGYKVSIEKAEFWQGRPNRLHDRFAYIPSIDGHNIERLSP
jgi:pyridoxamine 5'-phosphate oxidase